MSWAPGSVIRHGLHLVFCGSCICDGFAAGDNSFGPLVDRMTERFPQRGRIASTQSRVNSLGSSTNSTLPSKVDWAAVFNPGVERWFGSSEAIIFKTCQISLTACVDSCDLYVAVIIVDFWIYPQVPAFPAAVDNLSVCLFAYNIGNRRLYTLIPETAVLGEF